MEKDTLHRAADTVNVLLKAHVSDEPEEIDVHDAIAVRDELREMAYESDSDTPESVEHSFEVGDYAIDSREPTPSPEANTVQIIETTGQRADEYRTDEGKLVSEYDNNSWYPKDDPVVIGVYPNMSSEKEWAFPESRLRRV